MISKKDKARIVSLAKKYKVARVFLFGSGTDSTREGNDIDLAVEGIRPASFFKFYGELFKHLSKPVDLIDLADQSAFHDLVRQTGVSLYARSTSKNDRRRDSKRRKNVGKP